MSDYAIAAPTLRCAATGRELGPGDRFVSVLRVENGRFVRADYAADAWPGRPADAVGFWAGRVPTSKAKRKPVVNDDVLSECFERLAGATEPDRVNFRYVLALLLMRRKRLKFEDARKDGGRETLVLKSVKTGERYEVTDPVLTEDQVRQVQDEVVRVLGWE